MKFSILFLLGALVYSVSSDCSATNNQSPIDIKTSGAIGEEYENDLVLSKFCRPVTGNFTNDGSNLVFTPSSYELEPRTDGCDPIIPFMTGGPFEEDVYELNKLVMFWDFGGSGSEHSFDGTKYVKKYKVSKIFNEIFALELMRNCKWCSRKRLIIRIWMLLWQTKEE